MTILQPRAGIAARSARAMPRPCSFPWRCFPAVMEGGLGDRRRIAALFDVIAPGHQVRGANRTVRFSMTDLN